MFNTYKTSIVPAMNLMQDDRIRQGLRLYRITHLLVTEQNTKVSATSVGRTAKVIVREFPKHSKVKIYNLR